MSIQQKNKYHGSSISYYKDNIFDVVKSRISSTNGGASVVIPHVCNNVDAYGAGFAAAVADMFPAAKLNFHLLGNQAKLGHVQFIEVQHNTRLDHKIIVANMIAQNGLINYRNKRPLNYAALVTCMVTVKNYIKTFLQSDASNKLEIHSPKFGSGLAGGNWKFIVDLIDDVWFNIPTFIYEKK